MSDPTKAVRAEVQQQETAADREQARERALQKVSNSLAAAQRLLRTVRDHGDAKRQDEYTANHNKVVARLQPLIESAEANIAEAKRLRSPYTAALPDILNFRGKVALPNVANQDRAFHYLEAAHSLVTDGVAAYARLLATAREMLFWQKVDRAELVEVDRVAKELVPAKDLAFGVKCALDNVQWVLDQINGDGPEADGRSGAGISWSIPADVVAANKKAAEAAGIDNREPHVRQSYRQSSEWKSEPATERQPDAGFVPGEQY